MRDYLEMMTIGGENYLVSDDGFIDYIRDDLGYLAMDVNDLFTEFMDWVEDETAWRLSTWGRKSPLTVYS